MKKRWFNGKTILITGASSGFGKILATKLVKEHNCKVIGVARTLSKLESLKQELGDNFTYYAMDVSIKENWTDLAQKIENANEKCDLLINNAGVLPAFKKFDKTDICEFEKTLDTNFFASVYSTKALYNILKKSPYRSIINISSSAGLATVIGTSAYSPSKSALKSFTENLMLENKDFYVAIVCPGFAKTEIFRSQKNSSEKENSLINLVCSNPEKIVKKMLKKIARRKKRIVLGFDAKLMDFFARLFPVFTLKAIRWVLKKSKISLFDEVFKE